VQCQRIALSEDGEPAADTVDKQLATAALPAMKEQAIPA
jgi:hypothetical protein